MIGTTPMLTPSEKLRALIAEARRAQEQPADYLGCLAQAERLLDPPFNLLREAELRLDRHSEIVAKLHEWLPEMVAFMTARVTSEGAVRDEKALAELERGLVDRLFRLLEALMRLAVTPGCPCYDQQVMNRQIDVVLELASVINERKAKPQE